MMNKENAYVMNLRHRTDRWDNMIERFGRLNLIRVDGIILPDDGTSYSRTTGLAMTHLKLIKECKEKGMKTVLILEDDCVPEPGWYNRWISIKEYLDNNLDKWEVFNGCIHGLWHKEYVDKVDDTYLITGTWGGASHWIYLNLNAYDKLITLKDEEVDVGFYNTTKFKLLCSYPFLALQSDDYSDIIKSDRTWSDYYLMNKLQTSMFLRQYGIDGL